MTETTYRPEVETISIRPIEHFASGAAVRRVTWRAVLVLADGTEERCPHDHGHKTQDAAVTCGRTMSRVAR